MQYYAFSHTSSGVNSVVVQGLYLHLFPLSPKGLISSLVYITATFSLPLVQLINRNPLHLTTFFTNLTIYFSLSDLENHRIIES